MTPQIIDSIFSGVFSVVMTFIGFMIKRMLDQHEKNLQVIMERIDHCHERNDVQDQIIAKIINRHFNSSQIIKGAQPIPEDYD